MSSASLLSASTFWGSPLDKCEHFYFVCFLRLFLLVLPRLYHRKFPIVYIDTTYLPINLPNVNSFVRDLDFSLVRRSSSPLFRAVHLQVRLFL